MFKKSLRALGFTGIEEDEEQKPVVIENTVKKNDKAEQSGSVLKEETEVRPPELNVIQETDLPDVLLDGILAMVNDSLPPFVRDCLDREAEKKYVYKQLGASLNDYVHLLTLQTRENSIKDLNETRKILEAEAADLKNRMKDADDRKEELQRMQLSAERQKRALSDKVHELEMRVVTLEAEKEQLDLEGKSLLNKLKVANVHQEEIDKLQEENSRLQIEINELRQSQISPEEFQEMRERLDFAEKERTENGMRISELTEQLAAARLEAVQAEEIEAALEAARGEIAEKEATLEQLDTKLAELAGETENTGKLQENLRQAEEKAALQSQQFTEWQQETEKRMEQMAEELKHNYEVIEEKERHISELDAEMGAMRSEELSKIKESEKILAEKDSIISQLSEELEEANSNLEVVHEVQEKLNQFEQIKQSKEQKIIQLNEELKSARDEIERLTNDNDLMRSNLQEQVNKFAEFKQQANKQIDNEIVSRLDKELNTANDMITALKLQRQKMLEDMELLKKEKEEWKQAADKLNVRVEKLEKSEKEIAVKLENANEDIEVWKDKAEDAAGTNATTEEDNYDDLNWLLPVPPDSPETIAKRKEEEERKRKEEEEAEAARKREAKPDPSQMSLW